MLRQAELTNKLSTVFKRRQTVILAEVVTDAYSDLVKTGDFNELKAIVKGLAEAQNRTEVRMEELAEAQQRTEVRMGELAEAQQRTEIRMGELAEAQQRTESRMEELTVAQKETQHHVQMLVRQMGETNRALGGLGHSVAYALENEAYRMIPAVLAAKYGIQLTARLIRTHVGGEEINLLGRGQRDGKDILIVGETKLRLDERRTGKLGQVAVFEQLALKAQAVHTENPDVEIVLLLITHYARPKMLQQAQAQNIIIIQSFEW